jgi:hypothetical protein
LTTSSISRDKNLTNIYPIAKKWDASQRQEESLLPKIIGFNSIAWATNHTHQEWMLSYTSMHLKISNKFVISPG